MNLARTAAVTLVFLFITALPAHARRAGPVSAKAGDPPLNNTCINAGCHGGTLNASSASLTITPPGRYIPGAAYAVSVQMLNPQSAINGFEMIARSPSGSFPVAGVLTAANSNVQVDGSGYAKHTLNGATLTGWTVTWTAPAAGFGNVTFYGAGNASDASGTNLGDWIVTATAASVENLPPSAPSRNAPALNAVVSTVLPSLSVNKASDGNADSLVYTFQICGDAGCGNVLQTSGQVAVAGATASWTPDLPLLENQQVFWRVRAFDGYAYGPYMAVSSFWVDATPEMPSQPAMMEPASGTTIYAANPAFTVANAADPDPFDLLTYEFTVALDAGFASVVTSVSGIPEGGAGQTAWQVGAPSPLTTGVYHVMVRALDLLGNASAPVYSTFTIDLAQTPPSTPLNLTPSMVSVFMNQPVLASDPATGAGVLTYFFDVDTNATYAGTVARHLSDAGGPSWALTAPGLPDDLYHWRIRAFDGNIFGGYAHTWFEVDAVNSPPGAPTGSAPLDGAQVNTRHPLLTAAVAVDPEGSPSSYLFEIAASTGFSPLLEGSASILPATDGTVSWTPGGALSEGATYYWRVRARDLSDGAVVGPYSAIFAFGIVGANLPPAAPGIADGKQDAAKPVVFTFTAPADPDGDPLVVSIEVYADSTLSVPVTGSTALPAAQHTWQPTVAWTPGTYYWRAQARDLTSSGPWSETAKLELTGPLPFQPLELEPTRVARKTHSGGCASAGEAGSLFAVLLLGFVVLRRRRFSKAGAVLIAMFVAGCGEEKTEIRYVPVTADYAAVERILNANCIGCHMGEEPKGDLSLDPGKKAAGLINAAPSNIVAADRKLLLVAPGEPERSFLLFKITRPALGEGDAMPYQLPPLDEQEIETIRRWIAEGAQVPG